MTALPCFIINGEQELGCVLKFRTARRVSETPQCPGKQQASSKCMAGLMLIGFRHVRQGGPGTGRSAEIYFRNRGDDSD